MNVRPKVLLIIIGSLFMLTFISGFGVISAQTGAGEKVESVEVQLNIADQIYEGLQERIEYSIGRVGEKILLNQSLSLLQANQDAVKTAIFNVFSKVLIGFKIEKVDLIVSNHTKVIIYLKPVPPLIQEVRFNLEVNGLEPEIDVFTKEIIAKIESELNRIFTGLPVESITWSEGIFDLVANYLLERELPGFSSKFTIKPGTSTVIDLNLSPEQPVVSEVKVSTKAVNIPVLFVKYQTNLYGKQFNVLKGLPVEFLSHYQLRLQQYLTDKMNGFPKLQQAGMKVKLGIDPGVKTKVEITVDSENYLTQFDARYCTFNNQSFTNLQAYFGYRTENYELFTRGIWGENPSGNVFLGCYFPLGPNFTGGFEYEFQHSYKSVGFHFQFERGDYLDLRLGIDSPTEGIIGIYLSEMINLELVDNNNNLGIQFKFHF